MSLLSEARHFAREIVEDPEYRAQLLIRARKGYLAPALECMLWDRAWGKPPERIEIGRIGESELEKLSDQQLLTYAQRVVWEIAALPALPASGAMNHEPPDADADPPEEPEEPPEPPA
jgi:hypothetical protein